MTNQEAIKILNCTSLQTFCLCKVAIDGKMLSMKEALGMGIEALENQKTGHWIRWREEIQRGTHYTENIPHCKCSECNKEYDAYTSNFIKFCSNCGAKMEGDK